MRGFRVGICWPLAFPDVQGGRVALVGPLEPSALRMGFWGVLGEEGLPFFGQRPWAGRVLRASLRSAVPGMRTLGGRGGGRPGCRQVDGIGSSWG